MGEESNRITVSGVSLDQTERLMLYTLLLVEHEGYRIRYETVLQNPKLEQVNAITANFLGYLHNIEKRLKQQKLLETPSWGGVRLKPQLHVPLIDEIGRDTDLHPALLEIIDNLSPTNLRETRYTDIADPRSLIHVLILCLLIGGDERVRQRVYYLNERSYPYWISLQPLEYLFLRPDRRESLAQLGPYAQGFILQRVLTERILFLEPVADLFGAFPEAALANDPGYAPFVSLGDWALLTGQLHTEEGKKIFSQFSLSADPAINYAAEILEGRSGLAHNDLEDHLKAMRKASHMRNLMYAGLEGIIFIYAFLHEKDAKAISRSATYAKQAMGQSRWSGMAVLYGLLKAYQEGDERAQKEGREKFRRETLTPILQLWYYLVLNWADDPDAGGYDNKLTQLAEKARKAGYYWLAIEAAAVCAGRSPKALALYQELSAQTGIKGLFGIKKEVPAWEKSLEGLMQMAMATATTAKTTRLIWEVTFNPFSLTPVEQTQTSSGWSKGKTVALKRLVNQDVEGMTTQDLAICNAIRSDTSYSNRLFFSPAIALPALVGHPLLFLPGAIPVELIREEPHLVIDENPDHTFELRLSAPATSEGFLVEKETATRYKFIPIEARHVRLYRLIGDKKMSVPPAGKALLSKAVSRLSGMIQIQSNSDLLDERLPRAPGDSTLRVLLMPYREGFRIETRIKPFATVPPYVKPGEGRDNLVAMVDGQQKIAVRDLNKERLAETRLLQTCELLRQADTGIHEWTLETPEECLQVLQDLESLKEEVRTEWPEGVKLRIASRISMNQLSLRVKRQKDWFEASGEVRLDNGQVMSLLEVMRLLETSKGNFVQLSAGAYLALTDEFRKRLEEMRAWSESARDSLKIHPLALPAWEEAASAAGKFEADKAWKDRIARLKSARALRAKAPSTFQAEMRPYQEEGFRWLAQLAHWGVGACLADDMGLGKTIQALALLLSRAHKGPSLVVAPPTVARNWVAETIRFSPTLRPLLYSGKDRATLLKDLEPFDLVITSYGLMQSDMEALAAFSWNTIVLDEAQSIKNAQSKRSRAAMALQGDFKLITTGTPIENHLGELWNLFAFINPGLLGSLQQFNERFANPIERLQDQERRRHLQRLIQPFILRRRKSQVLDELPEKTEVTLAVELTPNESAMYEALRLRALEKLQNLDGKSGERRLKILAELMRLRRFCCDPRLIDPDAEPGSKLAVLEEMVEDLRENGHKALVFSQFVGFLALVREWADSAGIPYQYLDGSTPQKQRQEAIQRFQAGEGDLFLISLKAGGVGLNLTAADYVIHLDPWWNPAVEDQASDRAHRIGQERPVTIYRLVTKGAIEEKIVELHLHKRDLADSLLEGSDASGKISAEELLKLLQEH